jgi:hypothetical protein
LLLLRCLRSRRKAERVLRELPARLRGRAGADPARWTLEVLIEVCHAAGWLPTGETPVAYYSPRGLAHYLRDVRNLLHPGRHVSERPWQEVYENDYERAHAVYTLLLSSLSGRRNAAGKS